MPKPRCWICGNLANSAEHAIKRSDLKSALGRDRPNVRFYKSSAQKKNLLIQGTNSKSVKIADSLCAACNSRLTQPHDRAWETLSVFLRRLCRSGSSSFDSKDVFPGNTAKGMTAVHLYFTKLLGCHAASNGIQIDLRRMASAIKNGTPYRNLYLKFYSFEDRPDQLMASMSDLAIAKLQDECTFATFYYQVEDLVVQIIYATPSEKREALVGAWHPRTRAIRLKIEPF